MNSQSETSTTRHTLEATERDAGERLDRFIADRLGTLSRSRVKTLVRQGHAMRLDERDADGGADAPGAAVTIEEPDYRVKPGERFTILVPEARPAVPRPEPIPLSVIFEDDALIVIDKPAGLVVHPAAGNWTGTLVHALLHHCGESLSGIGGVRRPGIVHRLDKETSGLMVVAKTDTAHRALSEQFSSHGRDGRLSRAYIALVWGALRPERGTIDAPLARHVRQRTRMAVVQTGGRAAVTHYETCAQWPPGPDAAPVVSLLRCRLETGRTHQIRVHMAHRGAPLLGDPLYGAGFAASASKLPEAARSALTALGRQALHAAHLAFEHPVTGERLAFSAPPPADLAKLIRALAMEPEAG